MTFPRWAQTTRGRWPNVPSPVSIEAAGQPRALAARGLAVLLLAGAVCGAQTLETLGRAYHEQPLPAARAALLRLAAAHPNDRTGALALLCAGITEQQNQKPADAIPHLRAAAPRLPALADYAAWFLASAEFDLGNFAGALADLAPVWGAAPDSPLAGDAALLAARAWKENGKPAAGVEILRRYYPRLQQPAGDAQLAACYRAANDLASSAVYHQRVYYQYPLSGEAEQSATALAELRQTLGALYPPPTAPAMIERADRLAHAGEHRRARTEIEVLMPQLAGADRDLARVRLGVVDFLAYRHAAAFSYLKSLELASPEADAERLYYLAELARRMERDAEMLAALQRIERYPRSPWRLRALVSAANRYLLDNRADRYLPLFRACSDSFADHPLAAYCHWKVAWNAYIHRRPEAADLLRAHLQKFPGAESAAAALYFLGRLAESASRPDDAKAYYSALPERFPNRYYTSLAEQRLSLPAVVRAVASPDAGAFLNHVAWPARPPVRAFEPATAIQARFDRARFLASAGLEDLAETELRFAAQSGDQPHVVAIQLAQMLRQYGPPHSALRLVKSLVPDYLSIRLEDAPASFWGLLYPLPWRGELERQTSQQRLDPYLMAGLIRQESEFNPEAVSPARAYGLTQILPATGRRLLGVSRRRFRSAILFRPALNLRLGAVYLRQMYDTFPGRPELALAAYNAGRSRVEVWLTWADFREPSEFIETIPFSETRIYVFAVLRNAWLYRRLYSPEGAGMLAASRPSPRAAPVVIPSKKQARPTRRPAAVKKHR